MDEARLRGRENPAIFSAYVFLGEFVGLTLLSFGFAYEISGFHAVVPSAVGCQLGYFGWVPYIANHRLTYCALGHSAAVLTAIFYGCSMLVLGTAHFLYIWNRKRVRMVEESFQARQARIAAPALIVVTLLNWSFGLELNWRTLAALTNGSHAPFFFTNLFLVLTHALFVSQRYEPRREWPWHRAQRLS